MHNTLAASLTAAALALFVTACSGSQMDADEPTPATDTPAETAAATGDIVTVAAENGSFETLVAAIKAAGLVDALKGEGPFTVFAPTDDAFAKLPEGTVESLLGDKEALTNILTYHVVSGKVTAADVGAIDSATTLNGKSLAIDTSDGVRVGAARVIKADVMATNGVIHVIDTVLIPE